MYGKIQTNFLANPIYHNGNTSNDTSDVFEALSEWESWRVIGVGCERSPGMGKERRRGGRKTSLEEALRPKEKSEEGLLGQGRR